MLCHVTWRVVSERIVNNQDYMKRLVIAVIIFLGLFYAMHVEAEPTIYIASEPEIVVEKTIEEKVREEFKDAPIMIEVARCESGFKNVPGNTSDDFGPFQINQVHLKELEKMGLDRTNVDDSIKYARVLYEKNGLRDWKNSKHCWGKKAL